MSLSVTKTIVTPMQRIVCAFTAADAEPLDYVASLTGRTTGQIVSDVSHGLKFRSSPLYRPEIYDIILTAEYADGDDNQSVQVLGVSTDVPVAMPVILRQAIWDICYDAELELGARPVYMIHDGFYRPTTVRRSEVADMPFPAIEVGMPLLRTTAFGSPVRKREEWRIPVRLLDSISKDNPNELGDVWLLAELLQAAVDQTENLNLGNRGVLDKAWSWRIMEEPDQERDRMSGLKCWLTVYVERPVGAVGR